MTLSQPLFQQNDTTDQAAIIARFFLRELLNSQGGVIRDNAMRVQQRTAGVNNSVDIIAGAIVIPGSNISNQGYYFVYNDGTVNLPMSVAAHATLPRIDSVIVRVRDSFYTGGSDDAIFEYVAGTAAASPSPPSLAGFPNAWKLADISVPANDNTILNADITDQRTNLIISQQYASSVGGVIVCTSSQRPSGPRPGQLIWETDTRRLMINDTSGPGVTSNWQPAAHMGAWTTFTPNWGGTVTLGSGGTHTGAYMKLGRMAFIKARFTLGSGGSVTSQIALTPPAAVAVLANDGHAASIGWASNPGASSRFGGVALSGISTSTISRWAHSNVSIGWSTSQPFTWANGYEFRMFASYETSS